ncbi:MAG: tetratricopeptide repeat protein [Terracidiphilus sp.]|jgi:tetratricopeptide (TPR) repeat protein
MKSSLFTLTLLFSAAICVAQTPSLSDWPKLLDKKDVKAARTLCEGFTGSKDIAQQVEAQKCLANVALCGNDVVLLEGDNTGGGSIREGYKHEAVDDALLHLDIGLKLAPQDLSIHQGRLHVLEMSGRYSEMVKALDESSTIYKGKDALDAWMAYAPELMDLRQTEAGLEFMKVLEKRYPDNPDVLGNIGAFLSMLKRDADAIPYLQKAADLAPKDPINAWDLGRTYDYAGQIDLADKWYQKGISLETDPDRRKESACLYGQFVEKKLNDRERGCSLEKKGCSASEQTACGPPPISDQKGK